MRERDEHTADHRLREEQREREQSVDSPPTRGVAVPKKRPDAHVQRLGLRISIGVSISVGRGSIRD